MTRLRQFTLSTRTIRQTRDFVRRLKREAPGTHLHSLLVARMAQAAAPIVRAQPALSRYGGLLHDIGKLDRPERFAENRTKSDLPLSAAGHTAFILAHVPDGVRLAAQTHLPRALRDIIAQHHGVAAIRSAHARSGPAARFARYRGPRPQTREAALVLLADSVEAAARTLPQPTPERLRSLVRRCISRRLNEGQLEDSSLPAERIPDIEDAFVRVLVRAFRPARRRRP